MPDPHRLLREVRGPASAHLCVRHQERRRRVQAADWARIHTEDGADIWADYVPLCRSCHMRYDRDARPWLYAPTAAMLAKRAAGISAAWTPERRAAWAASRTGRPSPHAGSPCPPGCACGRHQDKHCPAGCTCGHHRR
jgi:hypothetical protein